MLYQLCIEVEQDENGYHAIIIDVADDSVLYVGNTHNTPEDAQREAERWIARNA